MSITVNMDNLHEHVQNELAQAKTKVLIAVAWISFKLYSTSLANLVSKGVKVKIICTDHTANRAQLPSITALRNIGVEIRLCTMASSTNHMHHKFAIIDDETVLNGSFNWSENAKKSFENLLVIKKEPAVVTEFLAEFAKIEALDQAAIRSLQALVPCQDKHCNGKLVNLLVFQSSPQVMTYEIWGDVVSCCSVCGEDSYTVKTSSVQDTQLHGLLSGYEFDGDELDHNLVDRNIDTKLTGYSQRGDIIHGIGFVRRELLDRHTEDIYTRIVWKNKFVAKEISDRYETDFGVCY